MRVMKAQSERDVSIGSKTQPQAMGCRPGQSGAQCAHAERAAQWARAAQRAGHTPEAACPAGHEQIRGILSDG